MGTITLDELRCKCGCGLDSFDLHFLATLQRMRAKANFPFVILSGCRCPSNNASHGGGPAHTLNKEGLCQAVDILATNSHHMYVISKLAYEEDIRRIGINNGSIHLDVRQDLPQEMEWTYYPKKGEK